MSRAKTSQPPADVAEQDEDALIDDDPGKVSIGTGDLDSKERTSKTKGRRLIKQATKANNKVFALPLLQVCKRIFSELALSSVSVGSTVYHNVFTGSELVDWLVSQYQVNKERAIVIGELIRRAGQINLVTEDSTKFRGVQELYRPKGADATPNTILPVLPTLPLPPAQTSAKQKDSNDSEQSAKSQPELNSSRDGTSTNKDSAKESTSTSKDSYRDNTSKDSSRENLKDSARDNSRESAREITKESGIRKKHRAVQQSTKDAKQQKLITLRGFIEFLVNSVSEFPQFVATCSLLSKEMYYAISNKAQIWENLWVLHHTVPIPSDTTDDGIVEFHVRVLLHPSLVLLTNI